MGVAIKSHNLCDKKFLMNLYMVCYVLIASSWQPIRLLTDDVTVLSTCLYFACRKLCTEDMTCFEPEACAQLVTGMEFHKFYFDHCKSRRMSSHTHTHTVKSSTF